MPTLIFVVMLLRLRRKLDEERYKAEHRSQFLVDYGEPPNVWGEIRALRRDLNALSTRITFIAGGLAVLQLAVEIVRIGSGHGP